MRAPVYFLTQGPVIQCGQMKAFIALSFPTVMPDKSGREKGRELIDKISYHK